VSKIRNYVHFLLQLKDYKEGMHYKEGAIPGPGGSEDRQMGSPQWLDTNAL
jgi:hypothetical protein